MKQKLEKVFQKAKYEPSENLAQSVWRAIVLHDNRVARIKLWILSLVGLLSLLGLIPVFKIMLSDLAHSGFYEYLSLGFANSGLILTYWKDFLSLLAESLPFLSITSSLTLIFIFVLSLKYVMKQITRDQLTLSF